MNGLYTTALVCVVQDFSSLETPFCCTSPIHLPCLTSANHAAGNCRAAVHRELSGWDEFPEFSASGNLIVFYVFLPVRIRNEHLIGTVIGTWVQAATAVHSQRLFTSGLTGCWNPPCSHHMDLYAGRYLLLSSHGGEFSGLCWMHRFLGQGTVSCLARGFVLWGQLLCSTACPGATPSGYFLKDLTPACSQVMIPVPFTPMACAHLELRAVKAGH